MNKQVLIAGGGIGGLAAAIAAVLAYINLSADAAKLGSRMDGFADEFAAILSRQIDDRS